MILQELVTADQFQWFDKLSGKFLIRLAIDMVAVFTLIRLIYYRYYHRSDLFLTFFSFNLIIFLITYLLNKVEMSMGAAFGLFAVFSMLRYRTEGISIKDMTYLFLAIAIGLISAVSKGSWDDLSILMLIILVMIQLLEGDWLMKKEIGKTVVYENIKLIAPEYRTELLEDLKTRTGFNVHRVEIQEIDFLKDSTLLTIFYFRRGNDQ
jgi:hypothetical protein